MKRIVVVPAKFREDKKLQAIARQSPYTRDFCSILFVRKDIKAAYRRGEVLKAVGRGGELLGFLLLRHLVRKPHTSVYYMGVSSTARRRGVGGTLIFAALHSSPWKKIQLVCEERNEEGSRFYDSLGFEVVGRGVVGKAERPYRRLELRA